ncbi:MAG: CAP domain-containing protein [Gammaproteobacteria bacterium]|nr:MAG: CAP domain-containing protein [Gammaproteobacteria bacterium]
MKKIILIIAILLCSCGGSGGSGNSEGAAEGISEGIDEGAIEEGSEEGVSEGIGEEQEEGEEEGNTEGNGEQAECGDLQYQQEILEQVNQARSEARYCGEDYYPAVSAVTWNCKLEDAAQLHTDDMIENNFFSHTGSDGLSVANRVINQGYYYYYVGENIAAGQMTVESVMEAWLNSPGHCANIMRSNYTEVAVVYETSSQTDYYIYWTQVFASPQ